MINYFIVRTATNGFLDVLPSVGDRVSLVLEGETIHGTVQFFGVTKFAPGEWVGIFLDTPKGKNDGSVKSHRYFTCPMLYGLFARPHQLTLEAGQSQINGLPIESRDEVIETQTLSSIVKIKIAKSMEILNANLTIAEQLERFKGSSSDYDQLLVKLSNLIKEESHHIQTFKNDIDRLNSF